MKSYFLFVAFGLAIQLPKKSWSAWECTMPVVGIKAKPATVPVTAHLSQSLSRGKKDAVIMRVVGQGEGKTREAPPPIAFFDAGAAFQMVH